MNHLSISIYFLGELPYYSVDRPHIVLCGDCSDTRHLRCLTVWKLAPAFVHVRGCLQQFPPSHPDDAHATSLSALPISRNDPDYLPT